MIGKKFGDLTVIAKAAPQRSGGTTFAMWTCECVCGRIAQYRANNLATGNTKSCGCRQRRQREQRWRDIPLVNPSGLCKCGCGGETKRYERSVYPHHRKGEHQPFLYGHYVAHQDPLQYDIDEHGCWLFRGPSFDRKGYGRVSESRFSTSLAHRAMYERFHGPIGDPMRVIDHLCNQPRCINPNHMRVTTHRENLRRGKHTKLNPQAVQHIRSSGEPAKVLAKRYGVAPESIWSVRRRKTWADVPDEAASIQKTRSCGYHVSLRTTRDWRIW